MSQRPFVTQDNSPNILIVPTVTFCCPASKNMKVDNNAPVQTNATCAQTMSSTNYTESSSESICENLVINTSESLLSKNGDSNESIQSVNTTFEPRPSRASNYIMSVGDSHQNPIPKLNLSRQKMEAVKENTTKNKSAESLALPVMHEKRTFIKETRDQQTINDDLSQSAKSILTEQLHDGNSVCSRPETDFTYDKTNIQKNKDNKFPETHKIVNKAKLTRKNNQRLYKKTRFDKQFRDKIILPTSSKYIPTPDKYKYINYDQNTNNYIKTKQNLVKSQCGYTSCTTKISRDDIKSQSSKNNIVTTPMKTLKEMPRRKNSSEMHIKSKVIKKPSLIKNKNNNNTAEYCKSAKTNDIQKMKCKQFYNKYKFPKISAKNKIPEETQSTEAIQEDTSKDLLIAKDMIVKELVEAKCSMPIKSVVKVADDYCRTPQNRKTKSTTSKLKKIKLVLNVICRKSTTSSSDTEDEESAESSDTENSNLDLSFLDDLNVDEIVESLRGNETCDLTSYDSKGHTANYYSLKHGHDEINNNTDITEIEKPSVGLIAKEIQR